MQLLGFDPSAEVQAEPDPNVFYRMTPDEASDLRGALGEMLDFVADDVHGKAGAWSRARG